MERLPKRLSLDEFSQHKGHQDFVTTVVDLDQHELLEVFDSHKKDEIQAAFEVYPLEVRAEVEEVSVDMWGSYAAVIESVFPNARIVYDRFHVMQHVNRELNSLRRKLKVKFRGLPHLLWKNRDQLSEEQKQRLDEGLKAFPCLTIAYQLKEELRAIYERCRTAHGALVKLQRWLQFARLFYQESAEMIERHLSGICNYFENRTTSGVTEGINTKIKLIKRQGYGFHNFEHFRLRLLSCFGASQKSTHKV